jgi:hypothetical protein
MTRISYTFSRLVTLFLSNDAGVPIKLPIDGITTCMYYYDQEPPVTSTVIETGSGNKVSLKTSYRAKG